MAATHRIARQRLELRVDTEAAAQELHAELSRSFTAHVMPVLDDVLTDVCPPDVTMRFDRVEIDVGVVPTHGVMQALVAGTRERLVALLRSPAVEAGTESAVVVQPQRLTEAEIALERLDAFLRHGATRWRDAGITRAEIEATTVRLVETAPDALRRLLERLPGELTARRIWRQVARPARERLLAWLARAEVTRLEPFIADWTAVIIALRASRGTRGTAFAGIDVAAWLYESVWMAAIGGHAAATVFETVGRQILEGIGAAARGAKAPGAVTLLTRVAHRVLPTGGEVMAIIERHARSARVASSAERSDASSADGPAELAETSASPLNVDATVEGPGQRRLPDVPAAGEHAKAGGSRTAPGSSTRPAGGRTGESQASRTTRGKPGNAPETAENTRERVTQPFPADEPMWASHAGLVIVWPFLPGLFETCGLTDGKRFLDEPARVRAVLLTAHLADGLEAWGEHELLVERILCGCRDDDPIATSLELRDVERAEAEALLGSVLTYWQALRSTSIDGLRRAFLCREGTLTRIDSGWKLEIVRAGPDVLLDTLPWGIGTVVLPWMEQPLSVEW